MLSEEIRREYLLQNANIFFYAKVKWFRSRSSAFIDWENHTEIIFPRATRFYYNFSYRHIRLIYISRSIWIETQTRKEYLFFRRDAERLGHKIVKKYSSARIRDASTSDFSCLFPFLSCGGKGWNARLLSSYTLRKGERSLAVISS